MLGTKNSKIFKKKITKPLKKKKLANGKGSFKEKTVKKIVNNADLDEEIHSSIESELENNKNLENLQDLDQSDQGFLYSIKRFLLKN